MSPVVTRGQEQRIMDDLMQPLNDAFGNIATIMQNQQVQVELMQATLEGLRHEH